MALQCGIIGITGSGKTTLFNCLSNAKATQGSFTGKPNLGVIHVPDPRLIELEKLEPTERVVMATVNIVDIPGLVKGGANMEGAGNRFLSEIRNTDALIHVVRCFENPVVPHPDGSVNPIRDIETVELELQIRDLESVTKKISRLEKVAKTGDKDARHGLEVLELYKAHFESFQSARSIDIPDNDRKYVDDLFLLSEKPMIYVCNVDESSAGTGNAFSEKVKEYTKTNPLVIAAATEADIAELESADDRKAFLADLGLTEPGVDKLVREAYSLLNLQTFFTVGPKEIRAWTIHKGMTAPLAAGVIHSDLERGFIRAEVMKYIDFTTLGSEQACKEKGKLAVEGKNYIVQDGDILHIRFNV